MKKALCILTLALFSLALLTGCGSSGPKLGDPDAIEARGTMIWGKKFMDVCFTHDNEKIYIYYDDGKYALFKTADLPVEKFRDGDNNWRIRSVDLKDVTANGYSDLWVSITHSDMSESTILWTWSVDKACYVNQPTNSFFYQSKEVDDQPGVDFSAFEGIWICDEDNLYEDICIAIDWEGNWELYSGDELADEGYLYEVEGDGIYVYSYEDGALNGGYVEVEDDRLYIDTAGYFTYVDEIEAVSP